MKPLRLFGIPEQLQTIRAASPLHIGYRDGTLLMENLTARNIFQQLPEHNLLWGKNEVIRAGNAAVYQLGWNCIVRGTLRNGGFVVSSLWQDRTASSVSDTVVQLVTRAVDTCTALYLQNGTDFLFAHLDGSFHTDGLQYIAAAFPLNAQTTGFCSHIDDSADKKTRNGFFAALKKDAVNVREILRHAQKDRDSYFGHFEIGIYSDNGPLPFGDFCHFSREAIESLYNVSRLDCALFETTEELENALRPRGGRGECLLI